MWPFILAYLGGVLTLLSPCVLPVVPFLFARSDEPFRKTGLPILIGMGLSFSIVGVLSATGGSWFVHANQYGRVVALVIFAVLGATLIFPSFSDRLLGPIVRLGGTLQNRASQGRGIGSSLILGASVGLVWAPCAGPILGLVLASAALGGSLARSWVLLLMFGAGSATSLGVAIFAGGNVLKTLKKGFGAEEWIRRILGVLVCAGVLAIAMGWDTALLSRFSFINTSKFEQSLLGHDQKSNPTQSLGDEGPAPSLTGAKGWLNSNSIDLKSLRGKVVLVDFWTYSCINCLRTLPYLKAWDQKYRAQGLVIIGVHSPEFAFEKIPENVSKAVQDLGIQYPVALDSNLSIWQAYQNEYWPAHYLIDTQGRIRAHHFGEGSYAETELQIQTLLRELHPDLAIQTTSEAPAPADTEISPETYLGAERAEGFASPERIGLSRSIAYSAPTDLALNHWALDGRWKVSEEASTAQQKQASIAYRFQASEINAVMGGVSNQTITFKVQLDGRAPGATHGADTDAQGLGHIDGHRLYQLIRQPYDGKPHRLEIRFEKAGAQLFAFTFG